ncbi:MULTISPECIES: iron-containing redox enzyme family protein [Pseudomonas]|uniref:iron-containing redox enzyme family protein n=1 Tax=Pseudomonas TaxID=286 RepID=UPI0018A8B891|nr:MULTISPECIES: iron-containing redox enzyme family protein [Pseudomonas]MBF8745292.1 iron-containing redox enzyme family protein [Pseudomonas monteilii]MCT8163424.1 iron-containing redox enzyme family protein [Pseudomonas sp. HD6422]MCT8182236.1 iron-containing redox enzyme family protein [Pseudomonas sp. HD6421]
MTVMTCNTPQLVTPLSGNDTLQQRYRRLLQGVEGDSRAWLDRQLDQAATLSDDLPSDPAQLPAWSRMHANQVAQAHAGYLERRRQGAPRRYFSNRAHALWFIQQVAPTKAVDGAWLYSTLPRWRDPRYHGLIRTYLEELGDGDPRCNHVLIYQRLLSRLGCVDTLPLADERYLSGALQLALGQYGEHYLPEVIGYNLGYEQPPLHLLITTYELAELGIDGHYFQLHVTIDNAASGHAQKAIQALHLLCPEDAGESFYRRVRNGYRLNDLGTATPALIERFDLQAELLAALERKRVFGQFMHCDRCRLQKRTINQWLAEPGLMPGFLAAMQDQGWIQRGCDPAQSRWWRMIEGPSAPMFGVFDAYEKQLWYDWIAADWQGQTRRVAPGSWEAQLALEPLPPTGTHDSVDALIERMSGNRHALPEGLLATQAYIRATGLVQEVPH